jgi:hypothetical protein
MVHIFINKVDHFIHRYNIPVAQFFISKITAKNKYPLEIFLQHSLLTHYRCCVSVLIDP